MREMIPEDRLHPLGLASSDDYDYDYDVYYYCPSLSPYIMSAEDIEALDEFELPINANRWALLDDDPFARPISPVISLSYTTTSDFVFPDVDIEAGLAGYSRLFRSGFRHASHRLSRRLDNALRTLHRGVRITLNKLRL